jgi:type II secretory pathway pseudopilin PulG
MNSSGAPLPVSIDRERVTCLLVINTQLIRKTTEIYNQAKNSQNFQQIPPATQKGLMETYQNCTRRIHCNLLVLTYIHEKYHGNPQQPVQTQQKATFPIIMSAPQEMPELNQFYTKLQDLYPEAVQFLKMKIQQMRQKQQLVLLQPPLQHQLQQQHPQQQFNPGHIAKQPQISAPINQMMPSISQPVQVTQPFNLNNRTNQQQQQQQLQQQQQQLQQQQRMFMNEQPSKGMPNGMPPNVFPSNRMPSSGMLSNGVPPNGIPSNGIPSNGIPPNGISPNGIPPNGIPPNGIPPNGLQPNTMSSNVMQNVKPQQNFQGGQFINMNNHDSNLNLQQAMSPQQILQQANTNDSNINPIMDFFQ